MSKGVITLSYEINANDFQAAGEASSTVKKKLKLLGIPPEAIRRASIAMYEAEMNVVIHGNGGVMNVEIDKSKIKMVFRDQGPGIPDVGLAMQEGYSTAPDRIREMGFGAGMGLPNIKRNADKLDIETVIGKGTTLTIEVNIND
ncbi:MAG: ATP-binding protein [Clostridia bacterium]